MRRVLAAAFALLAVAASAAEPDPRVALADGLLADPSGFARAVELYRSVLAEAPEDRELRLRLARVLAWSARYDESIAEYDVLRAEPQPSEVEPLRGKAAERPRSEAEPSEVELERAEALSWAGRNEEAIAGFEAVLARDPGSARAARGVARAQRWSGRAAAADRAYERALAIEEDPEAHREWAALRAGFPPRTGAEAELYADSEDFRRIAWRTSASFFPDLDTLVSARAGLLDLRGPRVAAAPGLPRDDRGGELALALRRVLGERLEAELELGARVFREAGAFPLARGRLQYTSERGAVLGLEVDHRDALDRTDSLAALEDGLHDTATRLTLWKGLPRRFEVFADAATGVLGDSNLRSAAGATLSWQPWAERELRLQLGGGYLGYTRRSELYYDPSFDLSGFVGVSHREPLPFRLTLDLEARGGFGAARQDGVLGRGPAYEVAGSLAWRVGIARMALRASRAHSQRESSYVANRIFATIGLELGR